MDTKPSEAFTDSHRQPWETFSRALVAADASLYVHATLGQVTVGWVEGGTSLQRRLTPERATALAAELIAAAMAAQPVQPAAPLVRAA